ncbi:hypothetical protein [Paenibacillus sp. EPM92]|uniref:hypothetical protein n=1 Tax=Paenibacillus sp. EPM92 TaxID=1561195 RepID=UPI0019155B42|nr:hypothetical protein [Paenibacillus sp. EPM92]
MDYISQYNQDTHIFEVISSRFKNQGFLNAYDFFFIIIWKANRAKSKIANLLIKHSGTSNLDEAVISLTSSISQAADHKERLRLIMKEWRIPLPTSTAILTALYPEYFTVYDVRVCEELEDDFHKLSHLTNFENIWSGYQEFMRKIEEVTPKELTIRDKDRYLWGKSFARQLEADIERGFRKELSND